MVNKSALAQSKTEAYRRNVAFHELMRSKGFFDWKSNWLNESGMNVVDINKEAAKEVISILSKSYALVTLRGPPRLAKFKSNVEKLYEVMDKLVDKVFIIRTHEYSSFATDGVQKGGILRVHVSVPTDFTVEASKLKAAIFSIFKSNDLEIIRDNILISHAPPDELGTWKDMFGDVDTEHRRLVGYA